MATLKARGRTEIARLTIERETPDSDLTVSEKVQVALMSDGNVLKKRVVRWKDPGYGSATHDYGWKVHGKIKAGLTPEGFIAIYDKKGFTLESYSSEFISRRGNTIENVSNKPIRTEAQSVSERKQKEKRAASPKKTTSRQVPLSGKNVRGEGEGEGPGLYVTNRFNQTGSMIGHPHRVANNGPFQDLELAEEAGAARLRYLRDLKFDYLLPVQVIEAESMDAAEHGVGHVWWSDGIQKGPPVDPRQQRLGAF